MQAGERLQKALANLGLASRREAEAWIRAGRLSVNGAVATLGMRVREEDQIRLDGRLIRRQPRSRSRTGVFAGHRSPAEEGDFRERLPSRAGRRYVTVSPMPRIDGGLELFVSDGSLAARLQRGVRHLEAEFSVRVKGELEQRHIDSLREGVLDDGQRLQISSIEASGGEAANRWYTVRSIGASGKDIRRLFERQGAIVSRILRTRLGTLALERSLARGYFRELSGDELDALVAQRKTDHGDETLSADQPASNDRPVTPRDAGPRRAR
jgi:23S rRNA pseudouridine2605 synthase